MRILLAPLAEVGGDSVVIRDYDSAGRMQIEFSRNVLDFGINLYSEIRPVELSQGFYLLVDPAQGARLPYEDDRDHIWPDLADRPLGTDNALEFEMPVYKTFRHAYSVPLGDRAVGMSAWPVAETELRQKGQQLMTARTRSGIAALRTATWGINTLPVDNGAGTPTAILPAGRNWGNGTVALPNIQISLQFAIDKILQGTTAVIDTSDLVLIVCPTDAMLMSQSAEIRGMLGSSVYAYPQITGQMPGFPQGKQRNYGLPPMLYDVRVAVEKTVVVTSAKGAATRVSQYAVPSGTAYLVTRKENDLVNPVFLNAENQGRKVGDAEGRQIPIYSTLVGFFKEEFTTEILPSPVNRRTVISLVTDYGYKVTSVLGGFKFTQTFSV